MPRRPGKQTDVLEEAAVQALGQALGPAELSSERRASMRQRILAKLPDLPPPLTETVHTGSLDWRNISPGVQAKVLKRDTAANVIIVLWRIEPGGVVMGHPHTEDEDEECLVLEGEMLVGTHRVQAGELHIAKRGADHPDLTTRTGCLVMVRSAISPLLARVFPA